MGWRERDWAKYADEEREALWGGTGAGDPASVPRGPTRSATTVRTTAAIAALVSLALFTLGQLPRGNPLLPALHIDWPDASVAGEPHVFRLDAPKRARRGGLLTISGRTNPESTGDARIDVHWGARPWHTVGREPVGPGGTYHVKVRLSKVGMLNVRVRLPNGDLVRGSVLVRS
jgi:hypothetical protein